MRISIRHASEAHLPHPASLALLPPLMSRHSLSPTSEVPLQGQDSIRDAESNNDEVSTSLIWTNVNAPVQSRYVYNMTALFY